MRIKPLSGQVLIEVIPPDHKSPGGVDLPDERPLSPDFVQEQSHSPEKPAKHHIGIVREIGPWTKLRNGMAVLPEFGRGARVVFNPFRGQGLRLDNRAMRIMQLDDVLAVLT